MLLARLVAVRSDADMRPAYYETTQKPKWLSRLLAALAVKKG